MSQGNCINLILQFAERMSSHCVLIFHEDETPSTYIAEAKDIPLPDPIPGAKTTFRTHPVIILFKGRYMYTMSCIVELLCSLH